MTLADCQAMASELFKLHGLEGWDFEFDNSVRRFGQCRHTLQVISMSKKLVELNTAERVKNTMLHEIAHALAPRWAGHDSTWRNIARAIGCDGNARYSEANTITPLLKYQAKCDCDRVYSRARRPRAQYICRTCRVKLSFKERI